MRFKRSLRYRVAGSFAAFGIVISLILAGGIYFASRDLERRLIDEALTAEMQDHLERLREDPNSHPPTTATVIGFILSGDQDAVDAPPSLRDLLPGRYDVQWDGVPYRAAVAEESGRRFVLLYNEAQLVQRERQFAAFLAAGVALMGIVSAGGGLWLAARVISPVTELARRVRQLGPMDAPPSLAKDFSDDELGEMARAFERYLERLRAFMERERSFTADASHELRTPLTIIRGAAEVLLADHRLGGETHRRLERIARAAREMSELTVALLALSREEDMEPAASPCSVERALKAVIQKHRQLLNDKPVDVQLTVSASTQVASDGALLNVALGNLVRNAFAYTEQGHVVIRLESDEVVIEDTGPGIPPEQLPLLFRRGQGSRHIRGSGIGLSLVKRIADRYGWRLAISSQQGQGTTVRLSFDGSATPHSLAPAEITAPVESASVPPSAQAST